MVPEGRILVPPGGSKGSHTKPGRTLLQVKTKNTKNEVEERREEENLMMMILGGTRFPNSIYTNSRSTAPWRPDVIVI